MSTNVRTTVPESGSISQSSTSPPPFLVLEKWISSLFSRVSVSILGRLEIKMRRGQTSELIWETATGTDHHRKWTLQLTRLKKKTNKHSDLSSSRIFVVPPPARASSAELAWPPHWCCSLLPAPPGASLCSGPSWQLTTEGVQSSQQNDRAS